VRCGVADENVALPEAVCPGRAGKPQSSAV
jgi:hypothetical protein